MRRLIVALSVVALLMSVGLQTGAHATSSIVAAGPSTLVSEPGHGVTEFEAAIDPTNPQHLAVAAIDFNKPLTYAGCTVNVSSDGGATWHATNPFGALPGSDLVLSGDPRAVFDSAGRLHVVCLAAAGYRMIYVRSADLGATWSLPTYFSGIEPWHATDKPALWVSPAGRIVVCALQTTDTVANPPSGRPTLGIQVSDDDGVTWRAFEPPTIAGYTPTCTNFATDAQGRLYMGFLTLGGPKAEPLTDGILRSEDGGLTWGEPMIYGVEKRLQGAPIDLLDLYTRPSALYSFFPMIETDRASGMLYAATAWVTDDGHFRPVIMRSADQGATFQTAASPTPPSAVCAEQMISPILHADDQGRLAMEFTCNDKATNGLEGGAHEVWLTASLDQGNTWLDPVLLVHEQVKPCSVPWVSGVVNQLDSCARFYNGADYWFTTHGPDGFHAFWTDHTTGIQAIHTQVFSIA